MADDSCRWDRGVMFRAFMGKARSGRSGGPTGIPSPSARTHRRSGQSVVEFAIILPGLLAMVGMTVDVARVFQAWMAQQAITRDTAEFLATDFDTTTWSAARREAEARVCMALVGTTTCPSSVRVTQPAVAADVVKSSTTSPIWRVTVTTEWDIQSLFLWPVLEGFAGRDTWTLRCTSTYEIWRGRL